MGEISIWPFSKPHCLLARDLHLSPFILEKEKGGKMLDRDSVVVQIVGIHPFFLEKPRMQWDTPNVAATFIHSMFTEYLRTQNETLCTMW